MTVLLPALPIGVLIGAVGIGGVLLPPALIWLGGYDAHTAAGTSSWCFLFTGVAGTLAYARRGTMPWRFTGWLTVGAAPAAVAGALTNNQASGTVVQLVLAVLTAGSGVYNLLSPTRAAPGRTDLPAPWAITVGALVGFGSAMTGTGGPVLLVPILLALNVAPLTTVAAGQLIQLPLVAFASATYATNHQINFSAGTHLGLLAAAGVLIGAATAQRLPARRLRQVAATTLIAVGAFLLATLL